MGGQVNPQVKLNTIRKDNFKCVYCNFKGSRNNFLTVDHVLPRYEGGTNNKDNLVCSCFKCNQKKGNSLLTKFIKKYKIPMSKRIAEFL